MRIAIYGLPCSGKTTLLNSIENARILHGSQELQRLSNDSFNDLCDADKTRIRIEYTEYVRNLNDDIIVSDGHYSFLEDIVFTASDGDLYDVILYLYCEPNVLYERIRYCNKNEKYREVSSEILKQWQRFEIESLREECQNRNKDFYVISDGGDSSHLNEFITLLNEGYSNVAMAREIANEISDLFPNQKEVYLIDGDKTIIEQDSYRYCCNGKTTVFDGDFYTGYQSFLFERELTSCDIDKRQLDKIDFNDTVMNMVNKPYVVISSGIKQLWDQIQVKLDLSHVFASTRISADTKYYITKFLKEMDYTVTAIGDSKIDYYMLKEANTGFLYIGNRLSRSLKEVNTDGIKLLYNKKPLLLNEEMDHCFDDDISICKSNSGVAGNRLASAHFRLGQNAGNALAKLYPSEKTAVLVLERGGRFFGDGFYCGFGGVLYSIAPSKEPLPVFNEERLVIVDSVINTGKSIVRIIDEVKSNNPDIDIVIVSNVIQHDALSLFADYKVVAIRASSNSFVGKNQAKQIGKTGPDTADRLFNIIAKPF